ncbi:hypothetical protein C0J52_02312, partial [Blattella germanica]
PHHTRFFPLGICEKCGVPIGSYNSEKHERPYCRCMCFSNTRNIDSIVAHLKLHL